MSQATPVIALPDGFVDRALVHEWLRSVLGEVSGSDESWKRIIDLIGPRATRFGRDSAEFAALVNTINETFEKALTECKEKYGSTEVRKTHMAMGDAFFRMGLKEETVAAYRKALEINVGP